LNILLSLQETGYAILTIILIAVKGYAQKGDAFRRLAMIEYEIRMKQMLIAAGHALNAAM
jgi:hypothetical protein